MYILHIHSDDAPGLQRHYLGEGLREHSVGGLSE